MTTQHVQRRRRRPGSGEKGQALVEFALLLPVFLLIVLGIVDFGFLFSTWINTTHGAREGARAAAVGDTFDEIKKVVEKRTLWADQVCAKTEPRGDGLQSVVVRVTGDPPLVLPSFISVDRIKIASSADMRLEQPELTDLTETEQCADIS